MPSSEMVLVTATHALMGRWARILLIAGVLVAAALVVSTDTRPAAASHTEIVLSDSSSTPNSITSLILIIGGTPRTIYLWAKNVDDNYGAGGFNVAFNFTGASAMVTDLTWDTAWLESTGRSASCSDPIGWGTTPPDIRPVVPANPLGLWEGLNQCITLDSVTVPAPRCGTGQCDGLLATITIEPGTQHGYTSFDLTGGPGGTFLVQNVVPQGGEAQPTIPATVGNVTLIVVQCADFDGDGSTTADDITAVALRFLVTEGTPGWDPIYDLTDDGAITADDITATAMQFLQLCDQ